MSYSSLVSFVKLSPNCTKPRNHKIDKITVHHVAGNSSLEALGALFADPARQASANYGIDSQGNIACFVEEENRAYTSSNAANDHRAITIEVANSGGAPNWPISDAAYKSLIDLCADICTRHGFRLDFTGDASGSLTMHRYFASTLCPGPYLANLFPAIADEVNARLGGTPAPGEPEKRPETNNKPKEGYTMHMRIMGQGHKGEDVRALQILLIGRGYTCGSYGADGDFGSATNTALRSYQRDHGLVVDGIAGPATMGSLLGL